MDLNAYQHYFHRGTDPAAPPLLLLHGTGGSERDLLPFAQSLAPRSALLAPRGDVLENGAPRFFRRADPERVTTPMVSAALRDESM